MPAPERSLLQMPNGYSLSRAAYFGRMSTDLLNRRLRFAPPKPEVRHLILQPADFAIFEAIDRHGPLPSNYLYEFTKLLRKDVANLKKRLTEFYNGDEDGPYLIRPPQQFAGYHARYQHVVYDLAPRARHVLAERGALARYSPKRTDPFLHRLMAACVGASLELAASMLGLRYIRREEILSHPKCPDATRAAKNPMAIQLPARGDQKTLIPDDLFGLEYPGAGFRFFALEVDRNTESIERRSLDQNAFGRKIACYLAVLRNRIYRDHWGLPNLSVLTVTTNATHALNLLDHIRKRGEPRYADRFGFACDPSFGANWRVPRSVLWHLLDQPWTTPNGSKDMGRS